MSSPIFTISNNGIKLVSIYQNGCLVYHQECTPDEVAKAFWEAVRNQCPQLQELRELRSRLAKYESVEPAEPEDPISAYNRAMKVLGNRA